ncbi:alpha/beta fold hydrolase [Mycolicibacterium smegmatis]|uniref:alpha/beta fold hydrolase n=1 Tax=Mycolicibacterium smegmatis TaxID=1772 RepID=UPI001E5F5B82|nr:alpha/beta fold hydrolase [Mycolicibacterium smegmatis]MCP2621502.1 alpha/beta fold hydrolase [Mycolicibacterium smegmatis]UGU34493.1 alpha/beta fold hydrolase [Mycolicibacterium smegmatis]ULN38763.1 alpha/beta fold hydrolase [Mycolicibacterium smegmatis]ULN73693.1 alpha/beta fold hydrolase [Mycolicibacterium smegmatis]
MWRFDDFVLDTGRFELRRGDEVIRVEPQVFDVLTQLIVNHERVVTKVELFDTVWGGRFVGEAALTSRIKAARRALGDDGESQRYIRTIRGRGYQFVGTLLPDDAGDGVNAPMRAQPLQQHEAVALDTADTAEGSAEPVEPVEPPPRQHIAFCRAGDGVRLAYAVVGEGPPLVRAANWMTHLGYDIESPVWSHWVRDLSRNHTFIRYDERGCGLSDWEAADFSFDDWVADLESVVEALGLERFPLLGVSQGGAVAVAYAARHPERVSRLVLCGAYARGRAVRAVGDEEKRAAALDLELARVGWGRDDPAFRQVFAAQFLPDGTRADWAAFDQLQRRTTSPENAVRFLEAFGRIDVRDEAREVRCPTLVMHSRDDHRVPVRFGEELASLIEDARMVALDSNNHLLTGTEPAWQVFRQELEGFLALDGS